MWPYVIAGILVFLVVAWLGHRADVAANRREDWLHGRKR